jgi:hypothetical protein
MEQTLIFSGLKRFPGRRFWKERLAILQLGALCSYYLLLVGSTYSGDPGPGSADRLFPVKPKNPI